METQEQREWQICENGFSEGFDAAMEIVEKKKRRIIHLFLQ